MAINQREKSRNVSFDWPQIIQKGMQAAHVAYMNEVRKHKPTNPRSASYSEDITSWQKALCIPMEAQALSLEEIRKAVDAPRNTSSSKALENVKKELAKAQSDREKVEKDFADLEKRYKELDGKVKSKTRSKK